MAAITSSNGVDGLKPNRLPAATKNMRAMKTLRLRRIFLATSLTRPFVSCTHVVAKQYIEAISLHAPTLPPSDSFRI